MKSLYPFIVLGDEFDPAIPFDPPPDVLGWRLRVRRGEFVRAFLRFDDHVEVHEIALVDGVYIVIAPVLAGNYRPKKASALSASSAFQTPNHPCV